MVIAQNNVGHATSSSAIYRMKKGSERKPFLYLNPHASMAKGKNTVVRYYSVIKLFTDPAL
jgi:hypothetical protein